MDNIQELYKERNKVSKDLITRAFCGELAGAFPYVINNANYFVFGEEPEAIPDRYFQGDVNKQHSSRGICGSM